ncbi:hypothetical protein C2S52_022698 [Perilla frutescens var. hirtella]|nr:hypothetical protein C2S52_022698 [Perilla frutescens var. hirtella]
MGFCVSGVKDFKYPASKEFLINEKLARKPFYVLGKHLVKVETAKPYLMIEYPEPSLIGSQSASTAFLTVIRKFIRL